MEKEPEVFRGPITVGKLELERGDRVLMPWSPTKAGGSITVIEALVGGDIRGVNGCGEEVVVGSGVLLSGDSQRIVMVYRRSK